MRSGVKAGQLGFAMADSLHESSAVEVRLVTPVTPVVGAIAAKSSQHRDHRPKYLAKNLIAG